MRIKKIYFRSRRDFHAIYECEHCGFEVDGYGYDDKYFHTVVIPKMICPRCGKTADESYVPMTPKYGEHEVV